MTGIKHKLKKLYCGKNTFLKLLEAKITRKRIPVRVSLHVTKYCNLDCPYCYANPKLMKGVKEPSKEELFKLIDEIYSMGARWIHFLGGEPLMRKDIGELISYAKRKGIFCEMNTNGMFIKEKLDAVKMLDSLCVSIDGDEEANNHVRGKGSYSKIIENIEYALNNNINLRLHCILTQHTRGSLQHILNLSEKYNIKINFADYNYPVDSFPELADHLSKENVIEFYREYKEYKKIHPNISTSIQAIDYVLNWPYGDKIVVRENDFSNNGVMPYYKCQIKNRHFFIDVDGHVYACGGQWKNGLNYKEVGLKRAWEYLGEMDCVACSFINCFEQSAVLDLRPSIVYNAIRGYVI